MKRSLSLFGLLVLASGFVSSAGAQIQDYSASGTFFQSPAPSGIAVGDRFTLNFTVDYGALSFDPIVDVDGVIEHFNAVSNVSIHLQPGSMGNWAGGSGGTAFGEMFLISLPTDTTPIDVATYFEYNTDSHLAPIAGEPVDEFFFNLSSVNDYFTRSGLSDQPLLQEIGGSPFSTSEIDISGDNTGSVIGIYFNDTQSIAYANIESLTAVPESSTYGIMGGIVLLGAAALRRRSK